MDLLIQYQPSEMTCIGDQVDSLRSRMAGALKSLGSVVNTEINSSHVNFYLSVVSFDETVKALDSVASSHAQLGNAAYVALNHDGSYAVIWPPVFPDIVIPARWPESPNKSLERTRER
jgi:hypothetical protein